MSSARIIFPNERQWGNKQTNKYIVNFTGTHLVYKNKVKVYVAMLWQLPHSLGGSQ